MANTLTPQSPKAWTVYMLFADGGGIFYVGVTSQSLRRRLQCHMSGARRGRTAQPVFERIRQMDQGGVCPRIESLETHSTKAAAERREGQITGCWKECGVRLANERAGTGFSTAMLEKKLRTQSTPAWRAEFARKIRGNRLQCRNVSGHKGVTWRASRGKWTAHIRVDRRLLFLGNYETIDAAVAARQAAEHKHWPETAPAGSVTQ